MDGEDGILEEVLEQIRQRIGLLRRMRGLSAKQLARRLGSTAHYVKQLELTHRDVDVSTLARLAAALGARLEVRLVRYKRRSRRTGAVASSEARAYAIRHRGEYGRGDGSGTLVHADTSGAQ